MASYLDLRTGPPPGPATRSAAIKLHGAQAFDAMARAGALTARCLNGVAALVQPGLRLSQIDAFVRDFAARHGARPATIGYNGYPHACCVSVNHVVCHGMPDDKVLAAGDILNVDVTLVLDGWHADSSRMYAAGAPPRAAARLVGLAHRAMMAGIGAVRPGARLGDVGHAIETIARTGRCSVVRDFCGHGIGQVFHDAPDVLNFSRPGTGPELRPGMIFTIEPILNLGRADVKTLGDGWTVVTRDRALSAQFEHTIGVTEGGVVIFTPPAPGLAAPGFADL